MRATTRRRETLPRHPAAAAGASLRLHLGCGEKYLRGYVNIDYPSAEHAVMRVRADVHGDIRGLDYPEGAVDEVRSHHLLEHFSRHEALRLLIVWRRWLKPGGLLRAETPDFEAIAREYVSASLDRRFLLGRALFGSQEAAWAFHRDFWDGEKFRYVLVRLGYERIEVRRLRNSLARRLVSVRWLNTLGGWIPARFYRALGGNTLPSVDVTARRGAGALDEAGAAREILSKSLSGREGETLLHLWLAEMGLGRDDGARLADAAHPGRDARV